MIIVCEPMCKGPSHEKVNSGFLYGLSLAFPKEKIRLYADKSHIKAIKKILEHDNISIDKIEYSPIRFFQSSSMLSTFIYGFVFYRIFSDVIKLKSNKIFFLSFSPETLYVIKLLKRKLKFSHLLFTSVLHGNFESIADDLPLPEAIILPRKSIHNHENKGFMHIIRRKITKDLPIKIFRYLVMKLPRPPRIKRMVSFFTVRKMMEWRHSGDFKYVALSPHALRNTSKYLNVKKYNIYAVVLPTVFVKVSEIPNNEYVKFATFGYGDSLVLHNIAYALSQKNISKPYEIRIIGMDNRGTEDFPNFYCSSPGRVLDRSEMESQARDIDAFLILYDKTKYRLTCSGSILESISMVKPIVHFDNECINEFNRPDLPIGIRCFNFDEYINKLVDIIESYELYKSKFQKYRKNILLQREKLAIEQSVPKLRESFTW